MAYIPLAKAFHMDSSSSRFADNKRAALARLEADSSFRTGIVTQHGELFCAVPRELTVLTEKVLRLERVVSSKLDELPPIAKAALILGLVVDEVVSTNDLEGVRSTRAQIREALDRAVAGPENLSAKRFRELARLYVEISDKSLTLPESPADIRAIYDRVMQGEDTAGLPEDGTMFRKGGVDIIGSGGKVVHRGVEPESKIVSMLSGMLELLNSEDVPEVYSSIMAHYVFEYIHPFYDGNGRTGRFLLAVYLGRPLSLLTTLSLSRAIAENRSAYYRSFREVEDPLNHGELTFFVINMLETVRVAQSKLVEMLEDKTRQLESTTAAVNSMADTYELSDQEKEVVYMLSQFTLFSSFPEAMLHEIATQIQLGEQMTRKHLKSLERHGLVFRSGTRPMRFSLTDRAKRELGLSDTTAL